LAECILDKTGWDGTVVVLLAPVEADGLFLEKLDLEPLGAKWPLGRGDMLLRSLRK